MKIRFRSPKEHHPTQDNGMQVLYAPGKRLAFKLRWYLILCLILLPALWLVGHYGLALLRVEAPALVRLPTLEVRAMQPGEVRALRVQVGDHVQAGAPLVDLDNPDWRLRLSLLQASAVNGNASTAGLGAHNRAVLQSLVDRAAKKVDDTRRLLAQGAATRGEVLEAQNALDSREAELLAFERSLSGGAGQRYEVQQQREGQWLQEQLARLDVHASEAGRVAEVIAAPGENVGPGTLLMRLEREGPAQLWVYLDPKDVEHSTPGSALDVRLPNGDWVGAEVISNAESANPLPSDLRKPFSSPARGLMVPARFTQPLDSEWRIDSLPVRVRFADRRVPLFGGL
ncbi:biotin/lipoyl-binding protein [Pantoea sp. Tr-811]|uniref:HlyD family secretion protein n=1 Tax=unclassified Pantoea TaxID=2630326 RepID=UPI00142084F7|nr:MULTISPECIES: HlyD family efflux transporter periplasmic adaptor subunit [unclassified Pantoea]NIE75261.1 biotin/lipoyl-binding protein [Pantoea sp. Ap-967]NIF24877.1 biotin/lipoyl-binding protein [Pantoea sp. Tr-811]